MGTSGPGPCTGGQPDVDRQSRALRLLVAAGGSGGHIYPALAIAHGIRQRWPRCQVLFVGARGGMEERLVPESGFALETIPVRGIVRKRPLEAVAAGAFLGGAVIRALSIVRRFRPDVILGTGGFAAGPVGLAAVFLRIPLVLQEQNIVPGVTNRMLARFAAVVAAPYAEARARFPRGTRLLVCGNPVRPELAGIDPFLARRSLGLPPGGRMVLMVAGSLGSAVFTRWFGEMIPQLRDGTLLFVAGRNHFDAAGVAAAGAAGGRDRAGAAGAEGPRVRVVPYLPDIGLGLAAADLVICRAGAMTLAELAVVGRASILIPSPHVTHHHQEANAQTFARVGAARVLAENDLDGVRLAAVAMELLGDGETRRRMAQAARSLARPDALGRIVEAVGAVAGGQPGAARLALADISGGAAGRPTDHAVPPHREERG